MMKNIVKYLFFTLLFAIGAGLVGPGFINWNQHKDKIAGVIGKYVAREVKIAGNVSFKLVPRPQLSLEDVSIRNDDGETDFLRLRRLDASILFQPLLQGQFDVENIALVEPQLSLAIAADGQANWAGLLKPKDSGKAGVRAAAVRLNRVMIVNGTVHYKNEMTGMERQVSGLNLGISAGTLLGPYRVAGDMTYEGVAAQLKIETETYNATNQLPLKLSFVPAEKLPQVQLDGMLDLSAGVDVQGALELSAGPVSALLGSAFIDESGMLAKITGLTAILSARGREVKLDDIKAQADGGGSLTGRAVVMTAQGKRPDAFAELTLENLSVTVPASLPGAYDLSVKLKGKNVTVDGAKISDIEFSADASDKDWAIKQLRVQLPGKSDIRIAGIATPKTGVANMGVQLDTEDFGVMVKAAPLGAQNALKLLAGAGLVKKLKYVSDIDLKPNNISLANISAVADGGMKISGSLDIARGTPKPAYVAKLNFDGWNGAVLDTVALFKALPQGEGDLILNIRGYTNGALSAQEIRIAARVDDKGLTLKELTGVVSENEGFDLSGHAATLAPLAGFDFEYGVKMADGAGFAKALGLPLPPPVAHWTDVNLHGKVAGDSAKYTFTAEGKIAGSAAGFRGAFDSLTGYKAEVTLSRATSGAVLTALPVEKLMTGFSGTLSGTADAYVIEDIHGQLGASPVTGTVTLKDGKYAADLGTDMIALDKWLWNDWTGKGALALTLRGKTLEWKGLRVENPVLVLSTTADKVSISSLKGDLWGGALDVAVEAEKKDSGWSAKLKGGVTGTDIGRLAQRVGLKGLAFGKGGLDGEVASDGPGFFATLAGVTGTLNLTAETLEVAGFDPAAAADALSRGSQPGSLQQLVGAALKEKGSAVYRDVAVPLKLADGKASFGALKLPGRDHTFGVSAALDIAGGRYDLSGDIMLTRPAGAPSISIRRADALHKPGDYAVDVRGVEAWVEKKHPRPETPPPAPPEGKGPVQGIMERLEQ